MIRTSMLPVGFLAFVVLGAALVYASIPVHPLLFLVVIYLITMRIRLLVDLGNAFSARRRYHRALSIGRLALGLWPDPLVDVMHPTINNLLQHVSVSKI